MPAPIPPFLRLTTGYIAEKETGCWIWQGHKYKTGYGCLKAFGKTVSAHRLSYELHRGPISDGMEILHSCDNKLCVNPAHLKQGTHSQNMKEASDRGLMKSGSDHPMAGKKNPKPRQANIVIVLGVEYESQKSAERALGLGSGTVRYWLKTKNPKATMIRKAEICHPSTKS